MNHDDIQKLTFADVEHSYNGKARKCCCGCSGTHLYPSAKLQQNAERRGYKVDPDEVSDRAVARALGRVKKAAREEPKSVTICSGSHIAYETDTRLTIIYMGPDAEAWTR